VAIATAMFALWFIPATIASAGAIASQGLVRENVGRFLEPMEGHRAPMLLSPFYYPAVIAIAFVPWVWFLPRALRHMTADGIASSPRNALLITWISVPVVLFTMAATKLPHYILPAWPALALGVAVVVAPLVQKSWADHGAPRWRLAAGAALVVGLGAFLGPFVERYKPVPQVMSYVRRSHVPGPLYAFRFEEPSLAFYGRRPIVSLRDGGTLLEWARLPGEALLVTTRAALDDVERTHGPLGLRELAARRGWNYVKAERLELVAFVRARDR
jgi:4-amino-4-deoxy-L-arabinose transferase-like glycosyltransferase